MGKSVSQKDEMDIILSLMRGSRSGGDEKEGAKKKQQSSRYWSQNDGSPFSPFLMQLVLSLIPSSSFRYSLYSPPLILPAQLMTFLFIGRRKMEQGKGKNERKDS